MAATGAAAVLAVAVVAAVPAWAKTPPMAALPDEAPVVAVDDVQDEGYIDGYQPPASQDTAVEPSAQAPVQAAQPKTDTAMTAELADDATADAVKEAAEPAPQEPEAAPEPEPVREPAPKKKQKAPTKSADTASVQTAEPEAPAADSTGDAGAVPSWIIMEPASEPAAEPDPELEEIPSWLLTGTEAEPATDDGPPVWLIGTMGVARLNFPYDNGPLCQASYAEIPVPIENCDTRVRLELGFPVSGLTQGDLLCFADTVVSNTGADWVTVYGSDGNGLQFLGGCPDWAYYGPLDEYGQVYPTTCIIRLSENGYYAE